ncbi:hypothetical protein [Tsuneonella troitsensis]|uniref:hypothetical protein n=1 Tax=Tsuneonella troitsensis TaxID=292222 RepID=UPI00128F3BB7|nr:hypothetical protein [Tsuneonella troitsensis]
MIEEQYGRVRHSAPLLPVRQVHSRNGRKGRVARQLADLPADVAPLDDVIAFVTHETMMDCDLSGFAGWNLCIDEAPQSLACGMLSLASGWHAFDQRYSLTPLSGSDWSRVRAEAAAEPWAKVKQDSIWANHMDFNKHVHRPHGVYVQAADWREGRDRALPWFSMWSPLAQSAFATVSIAGAGYLSSIGYRALVSVEPNLVVQRHVIDAPRTAQPHITINYFTDSHSGSTTFWATSEGRRCLVQVQNWLSANVRDLQFWSGNEVVRNSFEHRIPGTMADPKVAGLNIYRAATSCAFIYSSKPVPEDAAMQDIFEISGADIYAAREGEDLVQFAMRGAIRNADYEGCYDVYVYSREQAEFLRASLLGSGFTKVDVNPLDEAGLMEVERPKGARTSQLTPAQAAERVERRRANSRRSSAKNRVKKSGGK